MKELTSNQEEKITKLIVNLNLTRIDEMLGTGLLG